MSAGRNSISKKKDWNTPPKYVEPITKFLGKIDLDPCSNKLSLIDAETKFILPTNGLKQRWNYETIFINPPYGRDLKRKTTIKDWIRKADDAHNEYRSEILMLIPVATNTRYYKDIIFKSSTGICFLEDTRLKFMIDGELSKKGAPMACAMVYWGTDYKRFSSKFSKYGKCFKIN